MEQAQGGDRSALDAVIKGIQDDVYGLALRFLWHPEDAEDATQEILIRVLTHLGTFGGRSSFRTWVYRVASNTLLNLRRSRAEEERLTFTRFAEQLEEEFADAVADGNPDVDHALLLEEVRIGCTLGMLLCLNRPHRMAYILGAILELSHREAADVMQITPAAFRQRLSRARKAISDFMLLRCGLVNPSNPCRCHRRVAPAIARGRVIPDNLLHARNPACARAFPQVLNTIRSLEDTQRAVALYRVHSSGSPRTDFAEAVRGMLDGSLAHLGETD